MAVMNMPDEMVVHRKQVIIRKEPIFFSVPLAGSEPAGARCRRKVPSSAGGASPDSPPLPCMCAHNTRTAGQTERLGEGQEKATCTRGHRGDGGRQQRLGSHQRIGQALHCKVVGGKQCAGDASGTDAGDSVVSCTGLRPRPLGAPASSCRRATRCCKQCVRPGRSG